LKVSMRYKESIHKFLQRSLQIYMRYNDEIKKIINEYTEKMLNNNNLGDIKEEESEYNIYSDNSSEKKDAEAQTGDHEDDSKPPERNTKSTYQRKSSSNQGTATRPMIKQTTVHRGPVLTTPLHDGEFEVDKHIDKIKNELYYKFSGKIEKIISFFKEKGIAFDGVKDDENPLNLLKQLKDIREVADRNEIIEKLEMSVAKLI
jgi:hypothetical protein